MSRDLLGEVSDYYDARLAEHGATPRGVDWNGAESQRLRFEQLARVIREPEGFSVNDLGCGYGALAEYLAEGGREFRYTGCDVSPAMVAAAHARVGSHPGVRFVVASVPPESADYGIASGIFNVRVGRDTAEWEGYIDATLDDLDRTSLRGFAFNCLTSYSDPERMQPHLYYADPARLFDRCKRRYSRNVALLHDYGLYEFTLLVRKDP
jgi:SAM-dependent methyltransferase